MHLCSVLLTLALAQDSPVSLNGDFAWGRQYRTDSLNPVVITIDNPGPALEGTLLLRWGHSAGTQRPNPQPHELEGASGPKYEMEVSIPEKSRRRYFAYVQGVSGRTLDLWIFLSAGRKHVRTFAVTGSNFVDESGNQRSIVGHVGSSPLYGLAYSDARTALCKPEELPDRWHGYAPLAALVWSTADAGTVRDSGQVEALTRWIATGGHLVVARSDTAGLAGTFLENLVPVSFHGVRTFSHWKVLRPSEADPPTGESTLLDVRPRNGKVLIESGGLPLAVRRTYGRGSVTFLAFDPGAALFEHWRGAGPFWKDLLSVPNPQKSVDDRDNPFDSDLGRTLGSGTMAELLGIHPGVPLPSMGWAFLMIWLYVLMVGPVDYVVLRLLKRMELTWITFPCCVAFFSAIMLVAGYRGARLPWQARETLIVDCMPEASVTRGWSVSTVFAPHEELVVAACDKPDAMVSPHFTNMVADLIPPVLREGAAAPWFFPRGSTGIPVVRWCGKGSPLNVQPLPGNRLRVTNDSGLHIPDAVYLLGGEAYALGAVRPGTSELGLGRPMQGGWPAGARWVNAKEPRTAQLNEYEVATEESIQRSNAQLHLAMRNHIAWFSFLHGMVDNPASPGGFAQELDVSAWAEAGHGLLVGWAPGGRAVEIRDTSLRDISPERSAETFFRVFVRHD